MTAPPWVALALCATALAARTSVAEAQEPAPTPTPTATPTPLPVPPPPLPPAPSGNVVYVVTVTTTNVNAPITWVAAPITTNVTNTSATTDTSSNVADPLADAPVSSRLELDLTGCGRPRAAHLRARVGKRRRTVQRAYVRVPAGAMLVVRVNGRRVGVLRLAGTSLAARGVPLRFALSRTGRLTVDRPSGRILRVPACRA
jgi:hypothetical protein